MARTIYCIIYGAVYNRTMQALFWYYSTKGGLSEYFERAEFGFRDKDINSVESLAIELKTPGIDDGVSHYVRGQLSPSTLALLSNYDRGTDARLKEALIKDLNSIVIMNGLIYDSSRFKSVRLSHSILELLPEKPGGYSLYKLNRMLLDAAYPDCIRPIGPDQIVVDFGLKAKVSSKEYLETEGRLRREMTAAFGDAVRISSFVYWLP